MYYQLKTIECHTKFGRVHFLYVNANHHDVNNYLEGTVIPAYNLDIWTHEINNQFISNDQLPPRIPPHLLNVLLNQELPAHV